MMQPFAGIKTRFRSLEVSVGGTTASFSKRSGQRQQPIGNRRPSRCTRVPSPFGPDFKDPNAADFKPDPSWCSRAAVCCPTYQGRAHEHDAGAGDAAADRARLDEYFTSVRQIEQQLDLEALQKPGADARLHRAGATATARMPSLASIDEAAATGSKLMGVYAARRMRSPAGSDASIANVMTGLSAPAWATRSRSCTSTTWHELTATREPVGSPSSKATRFR